VSCLVFSYTSVPRFVVLVSSEPKYLAVPAFKLCRFSTTGHANTVVDDIFFLPIDWPCQHSQDVQATSLLTSNHTLVMPRARESADLIISI
jgi:hypothetical protein